MTREDEEEAYLEWIKTLPKEEQTEAMKNFYGVRWDKDMQKEFRDRDLYTKWVHEMFIRKGEGSCPRCGIRHWVQHGSGLHKSWMCDECGLKVTKKDLYRGNIYYEFVELHARKERERRKKSKVKYRSDVMEIDEK